MSPLWQVMKVSACMNMETEPFFSACFMLHERKEIRMPPHTSRGGWKSRLPCSPWKGKSSIASLVLALSLMGHEEQEESRFPGVRGCKEGGKGSTGNWWRGKEAMERLLPDGTHSREELISEKC